MATSKEARYKRLAQESRRKNRKTQADLKALAEKNAELQKQLDEAAPKLKEHAERTHRQLFDKAARKAGVDPDKLDDFWRLADVDTEEDPDPKAIAKAVRSALKGRDYLLVDEDDEDDDDEDLEDDDQVDNDDDEDLGDEDLEDDEDLDDFEDEDEDDEAEDIETIFDLAPKGKGGKGREKKPPDRREPEPERRRGGREERGRERGREREKPRGKGDRGDGRGKADGKGKSLDKGDGRKGRAGKLSRGEGAGRGSRDNHRADTLKDVVDRDFEATGRKDPFKL